jgi:phospholipid/cholesterol/gamma-HCH transport system substrate-binding protein
MSNNTVETVIGAVVVAIAALFFAYAYNTSGAAEGRGGYRINAEFDNIEGVNPGTDVRMAGIKIGTVVEQTLNPDNYQAHVTMSIDPKVSITEDTTAKITSEGLLGSKFVSLEPGGSDVKLKDGDTISYTQGAIDIWTLIGKAMFEKTGGQSGEQVPPSGEPPSSNQKPPPEPQQ